jgi:transposase
MARSGPLLTEMQWKKIAPLLPKPPRHRHGGRPCIEKRRVLEGILWILRSGARWRDLPEKYPHPSTCWRRLRDWEEQGVWVKMWRAFLSELNERWQLEWSESFLDGRFAPAKKGLRSRKNNAIRGQIIRYIMAELTQVTQMVKFHYINRAGIVTSQGIPLQDLHFECSQRGNSRNVGRSAQIIRPCGPGCPSRAIAGLPRPNKPACSAAPRHVSFSPTKPRSTGKCPDNAWDVVQQLGVGFGRMIRTRRNNIQILEAPDKKLIFAAIDVGKTPDELSDNMLHDGVVDDR